MYKVKKLTLSDRSFPDKLRQIPSPPKQLYLVSHGDIHKERPSIAIVGSRKMSAYGQHVTEEFARVLSQAGVTIVSGLALGIDSVAHKTALMNNGMTIAVLPCGLDTIYPRSHHHLANKIIDEGGALISEYKEGEPPHRQNFIARNRLVSGLADGVLITEAAEKSGTLHTANFALEQGRDVFAVPGNITNYQSKGTNNLIKAGATMVTSPQDIIESLGIVPHAQKQMRHADNQQQFIILQLVEKGIYDADTILKESGLHPAVFNQTLTMLEITGKIKPVGNNQWMLA